MTKLLIIFHVLFIPFLVNATTIIDSQVIRNEPGDGSCQISNGFPVPQGLVTEQLIKDGKIIVKVNSSEIAANVTALRGRHQDGTVRSILIQFPYTMAQNDIIAAQVIVDGGVRASGDPAYILPTYEMVVNNNTILPTSTTYLVSTNLVLRNLLPVTQGSASEEKQYTALAEDRFDWFVDGHQYHSNASYEHISGILALWCRFGDAKFQKEAVNQMMTYWLEYSTPGPNVSPECNADAVANPEGREPDKINCGLPSEPLSARVLSFAQMYLMTGYRDLWGIVAYYVQSEQVSINSQAEALSETILYGEYDAPRFNYWQSYGALLGALQIDATIAVTGQYFTGSQFDWADRFSWIIDGILDSEWNIEWIPFDTGSGTVPATGTSITQGGVSADLLGVYPVGKNDPKRFDGKSMSTSGYLMIENRTGGSFASGALSGISANATGAEESDYRDGIVGARKNSPRYANTVYVNSGDITGTTLTVNSLLTGSPNRIEPGENINGSGAESGTYIVQQLTGTTGGVGTYEVSESQNITIPTGSNLSVKTYIPTFQLTFPANFLIDYYLYIKRDSRIPKVVKANCDTLLSQIRLMEPTDTYYGWGNATWGYATYGKPYPLLNPVPTAEEYNADPYELPEYARMIAFVIKTNGDALVNGKLYSQWYEIAIDTANNTPVLLGWFWKLFGQFYGWGQDAPWMMQQESLIDYGPLAMRAPTQWTTIPNNSPDIEREENDSLAPIIKLMR
jgi:hypothetical protein